MYLIIIQAVAAIFAFSSGLHDVPAINVFRRCGSSDRDQKVFHISNSFLKGLLLLLSGMLLREVGYEWKIVILEVIACLFLIWQIFDLTINLTRNGNFSWDYLGGKNVIDVWLRNHGGKNAGKIKAFGCIAMVIISNVLILKTL